MVKDKHGGGAVYQRGPVPEFVVLVFRELHNSEKEFQHLLLSEKRFESRLAFAPAIAVKFDVAAEQCFEPGTIFRLQREEECINERTVFGRVNGFEALPVELFMCTVQQLPAVTSGGAKLLWDVRVYPPAVVALADLPAESGSN